MAITREEMYSHQAVQAVPDWLGKIRTEQVRIADALERIAVALEGGSSIHDERPSAGLFSDEERKQAFEWVAKLKREADDKYDKFKDES